MTTARAGITLGLQGAEQTAAGMEQVAQRGAAAFQRLRGTMDTVGTGATFAEDRLKKLNRGVGDATGAIQLMSTVIPGLGGSFGALAGGIKGVADVFATLSAVLLRNPIGLAAIAATGAFIAFKTLGAETTTTAEQTKAFTATIASAEQAIAKLREASDQNVATVQRLGRELEEQRAKIAPLADLWRQYTDLQTQAKGAIALTAEQQAKVDEAFTRSAAAGRNVEANFERLNRSQLDVKMREVAGAIVRMGGDMKTAADEIARGERAMASLQSQIDRLNFEKVRDQLEGFALGDVGRVRRDAAERQKALDALLDENTNPSEFSRLSRLNRDKLQSDLDGLKPKPAAGAGRRSEVDQLPEQYARLAASLDPVIARERELIEANRILEEAQSRLGVSTETITDLKARLADKAYAATEAGKADAAAVAEAQRLYDASITPMEAYTKQLEAIARALELNKIGEEQASRAREAASKQLEQANEESKASKKTARDLGLAFSSAFEDAVVGGKKLRDVIDGLGQDLLRVFIRRQLTEPLLELFSTATKGIGGSGGLFDGILGGIGKSLGAAIGGIFGGGGSQLPVGNISGIYARGGAFAGGAEIVPFARGGALVSRPTMFPMRGGKVGLMGEAGPEAIMPLERDSSGRLGVRGGAGAAPAFSVSTSIDARGADKSLRDALPGLLRQAERNALAQFERLIDRGGSLSRKVGRRAA